MKSASSSFAGVTLAESEAAEAAAANGWRRIVAETLSAKDAVKQLYFIPFDLLVIVFISQTMLPAWAVVPLAAINFGTWWCYYRIPQFLRTVSGHEGQSILIPGPIVEYFAKFISSCGLHHRAHYGAMLAMMAGFHAAMKGTLWDVSISKEMAFALAWSAYAALLTVDALMYAVSLRTLRELRRDKLQEANRYTQALRRSNEDLEQFAYIASHDLRSPLRAILNITSWIREDIADTCSDETKDHLDLLQRRVDRLDLLLNDLLQYSRIGHEETSKETIDLAELAREIFDGLNPDGRHVLTVAREHFLIEDYRIPFEMLLGNLIGNALKHHEGERCHVWASFAIELDSLVLTVEDDGPGVPADYRDKIFQVFSTLVPRDEKEASGMGLAIVKKIVTHKKGDVSVGESAHGGAAFTIRLPLEQDAQSS
ncbi:MAG: HAMP domain-containing sensor histidine kinase [Pseudomonadota bacterium]